MSLTVELSPEIEAQLRADAQAYHIPVEELAAIALRGYVSWNVLFDREAALKNHILRQQDDAARLNHLRERLQNTRKQAPQNKSEARRKAVAEARGSLAHLTMGDITQEKREQAEIEEAHHFGKFEGAKESQR